MIRFQPTISDVPNGARFFNADLHVHSYGASVDVKDATMTPKAIIDSAIKQGIALLSITDHNSDRNIAVALDHAQQYIGQILVLPGVEVTTAHGHLLAYFAPNRAADVGKLLAKIDIIGEKGDQNSRTAMSMCDVIREVERLGGVAVAAHIDRTKTGFEMIVPGYPNWKKDIICSRGLYGVEVDDPAHLVWYAANDEPTEAGKERRKILTERGKAEALTGRAALAHLQGSDSHSIAAFENAKADKPWTRIKMTDLTFEAFQTALVDPEARIRPTATIPRSIPRIRGMHLTGGFLCGEVVHFSDNLNCFIGGRGTGKSTAIRALGYCLGVNEDFCTYDNCPDSVIVYGEDANGVFYRYERTKGGEISVKVKEGGEVKDAPADSFRVEYYGQGELAEVAKDPLENPALLQEFLDRHVELNDLIEKETALVLRLQENASQLIPLESAFYQLKAKREALAGTNSKLKIAEDGKLQEVVASQTKITAEKTLRESIDGVVTSYTNGLTLNKFERDFEGFCEIAGDMTDNAKSVSIRSEIETCLAEANAFLKTKEKEINAGLKGFATRLRGLTARLSANDAEMEAGLAGKIAELKAKGLAASLNDLEVLLRRKGTLASEISKVEERRPELETLESDRATMLGELKAVREEMTKRRKAQLQSLNQGLSGTISDYTVFLRYDESGIITEYVDFILEEMHGTHFQEQQAKTLCRKISPSDLSRLSLARDAQSIANLSGLSLDWAQSLVQELVKLTPYYKLQVLARQPCPMIVVKTKGSPQREIPVVQLSDGQRHTILLTVAMLAESNIPLVIDQPEDDLDNAFIFSSIVSTLRSIKERRQVIVVTHNANVAVLGDSELILPMKRESDKGKCHCRGSIDCRETKEAVQSILEGGEMAFRRRQAIYGH